MVRSTPQQSRLTQDNSNQTTLTLLVEAQKKYSPNDPRQVQLTNALVKFIADDLMPMSIVESPRFKSLMSLADARFQIPTRKLFRVKLLPEMSSRIKDNIVKLLQKSSSICVTVDLWSNRQLRSYIGITAHFIDESNWSLESCMLSCSRFKGSHTAEAINEKFQKETMSFGIMPKITYIVSDSAANMIKAFSLPFFESPESTSEADSDSDSEDGFGETDELETESNELLYSDITDYGCKHVRCFAHTLQLVIKDGFKQVGSIGKVVSKASAIVSHAKKSIHATEVLETERALQAARVTRWNSQLSMIRSILRIPEDKLDSLNTFHKLTAYDRKILEDLVEILTPFETATHCIPGDKVVTSSMVVPCIRVLKAAMTKLSSKFSNNKLLLSLKASVNTRLAQYEDCDDFVLASALDPRFKLKWCANSAEYSMIRAKLVCQVLAKLAVQEPNREETTQDLDHLPNNGDQCSTTNFFSDLIQDSIPNSTTSDATIELSIDEYLGKPCMQQKEDPLAFWRINKDLYPSTIKIVPHFLTVPASSAPVERLFSSAGKVFRPERCRLGDKTFEELMFIKCNSSVISI